MWIETLELQNIKCFENKAFEFSSGFNIIIGDNGKGKTSIIESISNVLPFKPLGIPMSMDFLSLARKVLKTGNNVIPAFNNIYPVSIKSSFRNDSLIGLNHFHYESEENRQILSEIGKEFIDIDKLSPIILKYTQDRKIYHCQIAENAFLTSTTKEQCYQNWHGISGNIQTIHLWLKTMEISSLQRRSKNPILESVRTAIKNCFIEDQDADIYFDLLLNQICLIDKDNNVKPITFLSDGQTCMLSLVVDIAIRCSILNSQLEEEAINRTPGIVIIDEIDLHLHPKWQMRVVDDLKRTFPKIQFIATTHSPLIIQSLKPEEGDRLIDLNDSDTVPDYEYSGRSPEDILEEGMGIEMPQRSHRWKEMYHAAEEYYELLDKAESADETERLVLREKLDVLMIPYDNNPAYAAYTSFLKQKRIVTGIDTA